MPNNQNRTGRAKRRRHHDGPRHVRLYHYMLDCPAYIALSLPARAALVEVKRLYNGSNNGKIVLSVRNLAKRMSCGNNTADHALQELTEKGFIEPRIKGAFSVKFRRATEWRLADQYCDATGAPQGQDFLKWNGQSAAPRPKAGPRTLPWQELGISRATYYRQRQRRRTGT
jgi:hypothetical protein